MGNDTLLELERSVSFGYKMGSRNFEMNLTHIFFKFIVLEIVPYKKGSKWANFVFLVVLVVPNVAEWKNGLLSHYGNNGGLITNGNRIKWGQIGEKWHLNQHLSLAASHHRWR